MVTTTLTTSGMVLAKAGTGYSNILNGYSSSAFVGTDFIVDLWIVEAESYINNITRFNWVTGYTGYSADKRKTLQECASAYAAILAIQYDMSGFGSRLQAEDKINILNNAVIRCIDLLKEDKTSNFIQGV